VGKKKVGPLVQKLTSPWVKTKCLQSLKELWNSLLQCSI